MEIGGSSKPVLREKFVRVLFFLAHRPKWKQGSWALYLLFGGLGLVHRSKIGADYEPSCVQVT